ncbi:uncharacterized protein PV07_09078 [Cladophialophora immunda]|uniref:Peptidase S8/S53 domain-containing protein n=1 Tax=Cladophialophora immunda TaxID=569365 RepID=A0A0D2CQT3_9EURO|nr:uncharacterized protein PV07_09078 [Cladophialophora immunda]KIW25944.1 hypothetical protein PV07_09078 [Cladophialophora immunda]
MDSPLRREPPTSIAAIIEPVARSRASDEPLSQFEKVLERARVIAEKPEIAKDGTKKHSRREQLKQLVAERGDSLVKATSTLRDENFFHFLASTHANSTSSSVSVAVQTLVARMLLHPGGMDLLLKPDDLGNTPLHTAIQRSNRDFLFAVSGIPSLPETVEKVRQTIKEGKDTWAENRTRSTFLHDALDSRSLLRDDDLLLAIITLAPDAMLRTTDIGGRTPLHLAVEYSKCTAGRLKIVRELISRDPSVLQLRDIKNHSVYQYHVLSKLGSHRDSKVPDRSRSPSVRAGERPSSAGPSGSNVTPGTLNVTDETAKIIKDEMMLESLRQMSCDAAYRCLYVPNENNKELWFDYMPAPLTGMTFAEFTHHWDMLDFETTVKYVSIANVKFKLDKDVDQVVRKSRDDATRILRWLQSKDVKRILHVIVDDMEPNYHSNDSIERALEKAKVEILDWHRPDLCPSTIFNVGKNLKRLEVEGLPMLAQYGKLERIIIFSPEDSPDLSADMSKQLKRFDDRLKRNWSLAAEKSTSKPQEESAIGRLLRRDGEATQDDEATLASQSLHRDSVQAPQTNPATSQVSAKHEIAANNRTTTPEIIHTSAKTSLKAKLGDNSGQAVELDQHRWMQCMENFTTAFLRVRQLSAKDIPATKSLEPIRVALIDDGVDTTNRSLQGRTDRGRSFAFDQRGKRTTHTGCLIAAMERSWLGSSAINHAVDCGARVISMSWSVRPPTDGALQKKFKEAVQRAVNRKTVLLCASSDQGKTGNDQTYPHEADRANIIRIGAATAMGSNAEYVDKHQIDFLFPGHEILLKESTPDKELGDVHKGSSVATAIAAGLAALVLECVRVGHFWTSKLDHHQWITDQDYLMMDSKAIKAAFEGMSRSRSSYIWVWETFTPQVCERITDGGREDQLAAVAKLARRFLNRD